MHIIECCDRKCDRAKRSERGGKDRTYFYTGSIDRRAFDHTDEHLIGSPLHLKQIQQNIAGNAVKYNRSGGTVSLSTEEISCENGKATYRFICSDTGKGMSEEFLTHAFEPFMQEESSARTSYMGTGLGFVFG